ncbi:hypothetical protein PoB_005297400, partial [Plakobranchus ocellatus]
LSFDDDYLAFFERHSVVKETTKELCLNHESSCFNRCGEGASAGMDYHSQKPEATCWCDSLCLLHGDCCWDFHNSCPDQVRLYHQSNLRHTAQSICVRGYRYLKHAPDNAQANISSDMDDLTEENVETPYMSIKGWFQIYTLP